jgi:hypothetical protein
MCCFGSSCERKPHIETPGVYILNVFVMLTSVFRDAAMMGGYGRQGCVGSGVVRSGSSSESGKLS